MVQYKSTKIFEKKLKELPEPDIQYSTLGEIDKKFDEFSQIFEKKL
jgi:hypothetical protein